MSVILKIDRSTPTLLSSKIMEEFLFVRTQLKFCVARSNVIMALPIFANDGCVSVAGNMNADSGRRQS